MAVGRILICSPVIPEFDRERGSARLYTIIEMLCEEGWAISFVTLHPHPAEPYVRALQQLGVAVYSNPHAAVSELVTFGRFDLALMVFWDVAELIIPQIRALSPETKIMVDSIDLGLVRQARRAFLPGADMTNFMSQARELGTNAFRELAAYVSADLVFTVSEKEAGLVDDLTGRPGLGWVLPDSEELTASECPRGERQGMLFLGNFRHPPNIDSVEYLCQDIVPWIDAALLERHPISIVGNALDERVRDLGRGLSFVRMVGWVPDVAPYVGRARLTMVPLRYGAGTKGKLIQALMIGTPTVTTSVGAEGLDLVDGEHVLIADDPVRFAADCERLAHDAELWKRLAEQGRAHILATRSRGLARERLLAAMSTLLSTSAVHG